MDIQKERKAFLEHWYENNLHFDGEDKFQKPAWDAWQAAKAQAVPEGFVSVESSKLEQLKLDSEYFEKSCVEWTNRAYEQRAKVDHIKNEVERFKQSGTSLDLEYFLESLIELSTFTLVGFVVVSHLKNLINLSWSSIFIL
ncbi:hypothetical protein RFI02_08690 [Acinetobacter sichuanensis]|uniref:hypothetical protein n=1 Tax=Acinetobacter sichuanensis TaxID=2136183 RepID=UPI00280CAA2A|nr:hypothetical protein [Acinetobacter sichuanensis]MDQ9021180.1 hypothetical protein [Acinetobacter sichuanensis]